MRVLLDTHIVLGFLRRSLVRQHPDIARHLIDPSTIGFVSVASLWETAIKTRLGKLDPGMPLQDIAGYVEALGLTLLPIHTSHVITAAEPERPTRDPFDRLLLAQCQVENLKLVTVDRALHDHPLAWQI
ncbi:type II toxin-antitoxin system VapC family toxin [Reyranella sp. CPCC 100927]|uniref:type II toxin-antitoxin system VapC family toxin n=1 Tax=Reyranella sp. CPCC 100927 TaxID=2599616 RepID=UPI0011B3E8AB|nr:type II toxin-antitoxin system VapC family toxin [Reyranella sp. CPCC 100927]TWS94458.1 type II toxin-antitoxin system VapC family toxin [Reyranella sp. CPCC 100927]